MKNRAAPAKVKVPARNIFTLKRQVPIVLFSIALIILSALYYVPNEIDPIDFDLPELLALQNELAPNNRINDSIVVYERKVFGAESLVFFEGAIYTGTFDARILRLKDDKVEQFAMLRPANCTKNKECGRPLGMRLDPYNARLIVADAYLGLFAVTLTEPPEVKKLFPTPDFLPLIDVMFFNDVDIVSDGVFVLSESSTTLPLSKLTNIFLEGSSTGRVFLVDTNKRQYKVIANKLAFPNGVQLSEDKNYVMVAETMRNRIMNIALDGSMIGLKTDKIPGSPDNIRPSPRGGYWIAIAVSSTVEEPGMFFKLRHWPLVRWALHKLMPSAMIFNFGMQPSHVIHVRIDQNGHIVETLQGLNIVGGPGISEVLELTNGTVYFGSYYLPFLRKLDL